jgi:hypothetical protein
MPPSPTHPLPLHQTLRDIALLRSSSISPLANFSQNNSDPQSTPLLHLSLNFQRQSRSALHLHRSDSVLRAAARLNDLSSGLDAATEGLKAPASH